MVAALFCCPVTLPYLPSHEPREFVGGDTIQWTRSLREYSPASGWTLNYRLLGGAVDATISDTGTGPDGSFLLTLAPSATAEATRGVVAKLLGWVSDVAGDRHSIYDGYVTVLPNLRNAATAEDALSDNEKMLIALDSLIHNRALSDIEQYTIAGRSVTKLKPMELMVQRGIYAGRVFAERNRGRRSFVDHAAVMGGHHR